MRSRPTLTLDSVDALAEGKRATRTTRLRVTNDGSSRSAVTRGHANPSRTGNAGSVMVGPKARGMGSVRATSIRMGDRSRAAAVKAAPKRWATRRIMSPTELAAWKASA